MEVFRKGDLEGVCSVTTKDSRPCFRIRAHEVGFLQTIMPIVITYELGNVLPTDRNRVQCFFERLGWENLGGSSYRYPRLGSKQRTEDWFNRVIPALMLFRVFALSGTPKIHKFTLDVQSSTGFNPRSGYGKPPSPAQSKTLRLFKPNNSSFGEKKLRKWIDQINYPYNSKGFKS